MRVWSKDESQVLTTSLDNVVHVWTTVSHSGTRVVLDMPHDRPVAGAAWNPDQTLILSWTSGPDARLWTADGTAHGAVMNSPGYGQRRRLEKRRLTDFDLDARRRRLPVGQ